jgi:hypothetical protein
MSDEERRSQELAIPLGRMGEPRGTQANFQDETLCTLCLGGEILDQ